MVYSVPPSCTVQSELHRYLVTPISVLADIAQLFLLFTEEDMAG